ncbi:MAG TPA: OmpW family outer membrane protein [Hyphomicrobium sp.]|nr:OmpW family outer membrane protein [Hyphomicrobium sp.]
MTWLNGAAIRMAALASLAAAMATPVAAGDYSGDFLVRVQGTVVAPDASADVAVGGVVQNGWDGDVSTEVIPTLTLTYFFTKNIAAELFCCFAKFDAEGTGATPVKDLGDFWVFPPIVTLQYHFDQVGGFKPYVGAGVQYMAFFGEGRSDLGQDIKLDNAFGFALQAGFDLEVGQGWYLNADVKKVWLDTEASWGTSGVTADVDVDPWIFSVGLGYRFNLADVFGSRTSSAPLK